MKTIKRLSVVFALIVAATISSCGGSDDDAAPVVSIPANGTYINATVDGAPFTTVIAGQSTGGIATRGGSGATSVILVSGTSVNLATMATQSINISLIGVNAVGTFNVNNSSTTNQSYMSLITTAGAVAGTEVVYDTATCSGATGTVIITSLSATKVEGTFSFTGKKSGACSMTKTITAGSFRGVFN